ncbi:DNA replication licensing factor, mcm4 component [Desmophyllum pertusum]|uniref:DNA replication licensing factor, mcm4 component n=1 Tax=Desmophyllum pertusum TaxID=174260 RepID=A0A9W9ZJ83_9CNID|nr:DNA replication licensing factor, mcm4 component [Desmophyllum pertusum]
MAVNEVFFEKYPDGLNYNIKYRTFNVDKTKNMRSLNPEELDDYCSLIRQNNRKLSSISSLFETTLDYS